jgi:hypothetical protein
LHAATISAASYLPRGLPEKCEQIEYKTVLLPYRTGLFRGDTEDPLAMALNKAGEEGGVVADRVAVDRLGRANTMIAIMQRREPVASPLLNPAKLNAPRRGSKV